MILRDAWDGVEVSAILYSSKDLFHQKKKIQKTDQNVLNDFSFCIGLLAGIRKTVWRVDGAHFLVIAPGQHGFIEEISQRLRSVGNTISDLAGTRIEP